MFSFSRKKSPNGFKMACMQLHTFIQPLEFGTYEYANLSLPTSWLTCTRLQLELACAVTFETEKDFLTGPLQVSAILLKEQDASPPNFSLAS